MYQWNNEIFTKFTLFLLNATIRYPFNTQCEKSEVSTHYVLSAYRREYDGLDSIFTQHTLQY